MITRQQLIDDIVNAARDADLSMRKVLKKADMSYNTWHRMNRQGLDFKISSYITLMKTIAELKTSQVDGTAQ